MCCRRCRFLSRRHSAWFFSVWPASVAQGLVARRLDAIGRSSTGAQRVDGASGSKRTQRTATAIAGRPERGLAEHFKLTPAERAELLPSGQQGIFKNRIGWARTYLKKTALIESPRRAVFRITDRGLKTLASDPSRIDVKYLEQFPEFIEFRDASKPGNDVALALELP